MTRRFPSESKQKKPSLQSDVWKIAGGAVSLAQPVVVGILNVTPDSFSDGGELTTLEAVVQRADEMVEHGAGMLDVGGESTRPGASAVGVGEELRRVVPVIETLVKHLAVPISVDTRKAEVAEAALAAGAAVVNDVSALAYDPGMAPVVVKAAAGVVLMHMRGTPEKMGDLANYDDLAKEVVFELDVAVCRAQETGIRPEAIVVDPGIGFAKTSRQSVALLGEVERLTTLGFPVMVGPSRKSFLGELLDVPPRERAVGTAAACLIAFREGARLFRVHDVAPTVQALTIAQAVEAERVGGGAR